MDNRCTTSAEAAPSGASSAEPTTQRMRQARDGRPSPDNRIRCRTRSVPVTAFPRPTWRAATSSGRGRGLVAREPAAARQLGADRPARHGQDGPAGGDRPSRRARRVGDPRTGTGRPPPRRHDWPRRSSMTLGPPGARRRTGGRRPDDRARSSLPPAATIAVGEVSVEPSYEARRASTDRSAHRGILGADESRSAEPIDAARCCSSTRPPAGRRPPARALPALHCSLRSGGSSAVVRRKGRALDCRR